MADREPAVEQSIATNGVKTVTPWTEARKQLEQASKYWLATVNLNGQPHVMPVFGVWLESALYFTSGQAVRKARNLAHNSSCVITASGEKLDLIVEGVAVKVRDEARLRRVAERYVSKYGWRVTVREGAYFADYGAPSAGPPPYELYEVRPATVFGLGTDEPYGATRWRFS